MPSAGRARSGAWRRCTAAGMGCVNERATAPTAPTGRLQLGGPFWGAGWSIGSQGALRIWAALRGADTCYVLDSQSPGAGDVFASVHRPERGGEVPSSTSQTGSPPVARSWVVRWAWLAAGWFCFGVAVVGIALPGLPTTGPLLLALACFARGSERVHSWLLNHRIFGPPLQRWQKERLIPLRAKVLAVSMMVASFAYVALGSGAPTWVVALVGVLIVVGITVVLWFPHTPRQSDSAPTT